jgi:ribose transport system permease protein
MMQNFVHKEALRSMKNGILQDQSFGIVALLSIAILAMTILEPSFATSGNVTNIINAMMTVSFLAIGMTVVLIAGGIDLSVGSTMAVTAGVAGKLISYGMNMSLAFLCALVTGVCIGLINGLLITKLGIPDFIATLAMLGIGQGIILLWTQGVPILGYMNDAYYYIGGLKKIAGPISIPMILVVVISVAVAIILKRTNFGLKLYAVGSSSTSARNAGVNVDLIKISAYAISGLLAAIAGIHIAGRTTTIPPLIGKGYEISAIAAAVIGGASLLGGKGRVIGALIGALTLTLTRNIINLVGIASSWQAIVIGAVLVSAVLANRASSDFGRKLTRRSKNRL